MNMLGSDALLLRDVVSDLDREVTDGEIADLELALTAWDVIEEANRQLQVVRGILTKRLAEAMPEKRITVMGTGTFVKHGKRDRTQWDTEELRRAVLDSRLVDPTTGEVTEESPLDRVLHVWNLGAPRVGALRARGLDPEEWCTSRFGGWSIVLEAS